MTFFIWQSFIPAYGTIHNARPPSFQHARLPVMSNSHNPRHICAGHMLTSMPLAKVSQQSATCVFIADTCCCALQCIYNASSPIHGSNSQCRLDKGLDIRSYQHCGLQLILQIQQHEEHSGIHQQVQRMNHVSDANDAAGSRGITVHCMLKLVLPLQQPCSCSIPACKGLLA
jgi:hypothetical protein